MPKYTVASASWIWGPESRANRSDGRKPEPQKEPEGIRHAVEDDSASTLCGRSTAGLKLWEMDFLTAVGARPRCPECDGLAIR